MFSRQPRSPASTVSAPVATMSRTLSDTMRTEISGYFTQNVPPNPQQTSASAISVTLAADRPQQSSRLFLDAELAQAGATVVIGDRAADIPRLQAFDAHDIGEEADQLESSFGERVGARAQIGVVIEQVRQVMLQHAAARA